MDLGKWLGGEHVISEPLRPEHFDKFADLPPGNHLEALKGNRAGQYSIRVNDQYRICFVWRDGNAHDVEVVDYH